VPLSDSIPGDWKLGIQIAVDGHLEPMDWALSEPMQADSVELGEGIYFVNLCLRRPDGAVLLQTETAEVVAGQCTAVDLHCAMESILASPHAPALEELE
jgi:hypothetical protein